MHLTRLLCNIYVGYHLHGFMKISATLSAYNSTSEIQFTASVNYVALSARHRYHRLDFNEAFWCTRRFRLKK